MTNQDWSSQRDEINPEEMQRRAEELETIPNIPTDDFHKKITLITRVFPQRIEMVESNELSNDITTGISPPPMGVTNVTP